MADLPGVLLSVRGEASVTVAPDYAVLSCQITTTEDSKVQALDAAAAALDTTTAGLSALGGVALTPATLRAPLTWSARSSTTQAEHDFDKQTGNHGPTGRIEAYVLVSLTVRDFALLDDLGAVLAAQEAIAIHQVSWQVDDDNPAWPEVRADAVHAAIARGRDYASALGSTLIKVEHVADAGLLGPDSGSGGVRMAMAASARGRGAPDTPSLDPVPQQLSATIEARFLASESIVSDPQVFG